MFNEFKSTITHPLFAGPLGGGVVVLLAYIDSRYKDVKKDNMTYLKLFAVSSIVFSTIIYFISTEFNKTDDFLKQKYDTSLPSFNPSSKGGFATDTGSTLDITGNNSLENQISLKSPHENVENIMKSLPPIGTYNKSSHRHSHRHSKVDMKITPKYT